MKEKLTSNEVKEFTRVYGGQNKAVALLERAGWPVGRLPTTNQDAAHFWREVESQLAWGIIDDGRQILLRMAAEEYPANATFKAGLAAAEDGAGSGLLAAPTLTDQSDVVTVRDNDVTSDEGSVEAVVGQVSPPACEASTGSSAADGGSTAVVVEAPNAPASRRRPRRFRWLAVSGVCAVVVIGIVFFFVPDSREPGPPQLAPHCGLQPNDSFYGSVTPAAGSGCVGVSDNISNFQIDDDAPPDQKLNDVGQLIWNLNQKVKDDPHVTLVLIGDLTEPPPQKESGVSVLRVNEREHLLGVAAAQMVNNKGTNTKVEVLFANAGPRMESADIVGRQLVDLMARDNRLNIVGVVGPEFSRKPTDRLVQFLLEHKIPVMAPTLAYDKFTAGPHPPLYFQIVAPDKAEASAMVSYAIQNVVPTRARAEAVVLDSDDTTDLYPNDLSRDVLAAARADGFRIQPEPPFRSIRGTPPTGASHENSFTVGNELCHWNGSEEPFPGVVFFDGRAEDFADLLRGIDQGCASHRYPAIVADGDAAGLLADPHNRNIAPAIHFDYVSLAAVVHGTRPCELLAPELGDFRTYSADGPDFDAFYQTLCLNSTGSHPDLDEKALIFFDAINIYAAAEHKLGPGVVAPLAIADKLGETDITGASGKIKWDGTETGAPQNKPVTIMSESQDPADPAMRANPRHAVDCLPIADSRYNCKE
ncbi:effector-associated domain EAD1-containing protein [Frankia sp. CiP3]|uniref:effector-associated domain EAD1-containing protein n=1 Tax=Frankia sp. CiP3 TaxID=2880971 RepID=UPI001EF6A938|nr:effector-associated domain EAD1-containing protein [Frankia sp. CiP3]